MFIFHEILWYKNYLICFFLRIFIAMAALIKYFMQVRIVNLLSAMNTLNESVLW